MKIVVTGSLGHISKPLTEELIQKGHSVTVISSKEERRPAIEALGATAAIGTMQDATFLTQTFQGSDIVYLMEAVGASNFFDPSIELNNSISVICKNYKQAIEASNVKRIVHLSSIGGHTDTGNGILAFHYHAEQILGQLPSDVSIKFMRPVGFYYNMYSFIPSIKAKGVILSNYGGEGKEPWVSPIDIAHTIAEEIEKPFNGREIRYIASDEVSPSEIAVAIGNAIGKEVTWVKISDEEAFKSLIDIGMNPTIAKGMVEMNAGREDGINGTLFEDYRKHQPTLGNVKIEDFAKEFAIAYHAQ